MPDPPIPRILQQYREITHQVSEGGSARPPLAPQPVGTQGQEIPRVEPRHDTHVRMFDIASNQEVNVPGEQATEAFTSGRYQFIHGDRVSVRLHDGRVGTVPTSEASGVINSGGSIVSPAAVWAQRLADEVHTPMGQVEAGAMGFLRGALPSVPGTPLGADKFIQDVGDLAGGNAEDIRDRQLALQAAHPTTSMVGELVGLGAGAAFGNEGNLVGGVGNLAEHGAANIVGREAPTLLGRMGQRGAIYGARGLAEGGLLGAQQATSEEALGDPDANGEKLISAIGYGALMGGLTGGLLGGAGGLFSRSPVRMPTPGAADIERVAEKAAGVEPGAAAARPPGTFARVASAASGGSAQTIEDMGPLNWTWATWHPGRKTSASRRS
jgi:hypothetical protein